MANPTFAPNKDGHLYRGMYITIGDLNHILTNGFELSKTSWHTGAKGKSAIISTSSSDREAMTYIFQSVKTETIRQNGIGVVFKLKHTAEHSLFKDEQLNRTNTIYHCYKDIPASDIVDFYILGEYGLESMGTVQDRLTSGSAKNTKWRDAFSVGATFYR